MQRDSVDHATAFHALAELGSEAVRLIADHARDLLLVLDDRGDILRASPSHRMLLGRDPEDVIGHHCGEWIHPEDQEMQRAIFSERTDVCASDVESCSVSIDSDEASRFRGFRFTPSYVLVPAHSTAETGIDLCRSGDLCGQCRRIKLHATFKFVSDRAFKTKSRSDLELREYLLAHQQTLSYDASVVCAGGDGTSTSAVPTR